jgi:hypothetical protein
MLNEDGGVRSGFGFFHSTLNIQHSTFNIASRSAFRLFRLR